MIKICCEDLRLEIDDYKRITLRNNTIRFDKCMITYCPFCGKKLKVLK